MGLHALVHDAQLGSQPINVLLDVRVQCFQVNSILAQSVQNGFLAGEARLPHGKASFRPDLGCFAVYVKCLDNLGEEVACQVGNCIQCSRLELLESSMVKHLCNTALKGGSTRPLRHDGTVIGYNYRPYVHFLERLRIVLLELVLICLVK